MLFSSVCFAYIYIYLFIVKHIQIVGLNNTIETWTGETLNDSNPLSHSDNSQSYSVDASVIETISIESGKYHFNWDKQLNIS